MSVSQDEAAAMRRMWAAVVLVALDDAISDQANGHDGVGSIRYWANTKWGKQVQSMAGIEPGRRATDGLVAFAQRGVRTTEALGLGRVRGGK